MTTVRAAVIGTGPDPDNPTVEGFAMGYRHADAYEAIDDCEIVACADIVEENALAFAEHYNIDESSVFEDYNEMVEEIEPDIVSITVPPMLHADIVLDCLRSGKVDAIHCEKPMADNLADAQQMTLQAERRDVQLTFNHQRRFSNLFRNAKDLIDEGRIGDIERLETTWGDFFDTGSHAIDLFGYLNDESSAEWVMGQLDYRTEDVRFGMHQENQMFAMWEYQNGAYGLLSTGEGSDLFEAGFQITGTEGVIEIVPPGDSKLRIKEHGETEWEDIDCGEDSLHGPNFIDRSVANVVEAYRTGEPSELRAMNAINTAEIIFGGYESVRKRGRVDLPTSIEDNPLEQMVESGALNPEPDE